MENHEWDQNLYVTPVFVWIPSVEIEHGWWRSARLVRHTRELVGLLRNRSEVVVVVGRPFPRESVGGWRKDEVQWMSSALVGDRKGIQPQNLYTNCLSWNVLSLHSSSFTAVTSLVSIRHGRMVLKRMYKKVESRKTSQPRFTKPTCEWRFFYCNIL